MKKKFFVMLAAALFCLALCGCGVSKEEVVEKIFEEKADSFHSLMDMDLDVTMGMGGMSLDMSMNATMNVDFDGKDPDSSSVHANMSISTSAMNQRNTQSMELYTVTEDGMSKNYMTDTNNAGRWRLYAADAATGNKMDEATRQKFLDELKAVLMTADLEKDTQTIGSEECYELKLDTDASVLNGVVDVLWDAMDAEARVEMRQSGVDITDVKSYLPYIKIKASVYTSKENGKIMQVDLDLSETDTAGLLQKAAGAAGAAAASMGVNISAVKLDIVKLDISFRMSDYNNVTVTVPDEVRQSAEGGAGEDEAEEEEEEYAD